MMIEQLETSITHPTERRDDPLAQFPPAPVALEYQPPQPRAPRGGDMAWGVVISVLIAKGVGWMLFGMLMLANLRDDHAGPVAVGAAFIVLGLGLAGSLAWTRRHQQIPPQQPPTR